MVQALTNESAWFTSENLGTDIRVKEAGGPTIKAAVPKEGVIGWLDAEQKMKTKNADRFKQFINSWGQAKWIPPLFKEFKEAWFNEAAYKLLVNQGQGDVADALLLQPARGGAQGAPEGTVEESQRLHPRVQLGVRRVDPDAAIEAGGADGVSRGEPRTAV